MSDEKDLIEKATAKLKFEMNDSKAWYELIGRIGKVVKCLPDITPEGNAHMEAAIAKLVAENLELRTRIGLTAMGLDNVKAMLETTAKDVNSIIASRDVMIGKLVMARSLLSEVVDMAPFSMSQKEAELIQKIKDGLSVTGVEE